MVLIDTALISEFQSNTGLTQDPFVASFPLRSQSSTRISLACVHCRSRHLRCDAVSPVCSRCQADGKQCLYERSRRGGRRPRKPGRSKDDSPSSLRSPHEQPDTQPLDYSLNRCLDPTIYSEWTAVLADKSSDQSSSDNVTPAHDFSLRGSTRRLDETINVELEAPKPWIEDDLLDLYYSFFHVAHPCALPCSFLKQRLDFNLPELRPVLLVMQYIGSLYSSSIPSPPLEALVIDALGENQITATQSNGYLVQALILYSVAVYWCDDIDRGLKLLDQAIFTAVDIGMNRQDFATEYGSGDPVLQECWRRTWWTIYVVDAHIAGSTHKYPFKAHNIVVSVDLPCEEQQYESGVSCVFTFENSKITDCRLR